MARGGPSEKEFMAQVKKLAVLRGWLVYHTFDSRRSAAGFPDLVLVRGEHLIVAELKTDGGKLTADQERWLRALQVAGVRVVIWRPAYWPAIEEALE